MSQLPLTIRPGAVWEAVDAGYQDIRYELSAGMAKVTICRPEVRNAFRPATLFELQDAFERARNAAEVGCVILTGEGPEAFCSGGDQRVRGDDGYVGLDGVGRLNVLDLQVQIRRLPKPVVAMVAGYAIGGGHVLHLVCDLTIAASNAVFGQTGPKVGSFDGGYGSGLLARIVGQKKAREIWFLCRQYDAQEALAMGLVNAVVPLEALEEETVTWCTEMLRHSPLALRMLKASLNAADDGLAGIQQLAGDATLLYYMSEEAQEGKQAYLEKRRPQFERFPRRPERGCDQFCGSGGRAVTTASQWLAGARPRTLPLALCPVLVGTAASAPHFSVSWWKMGVAAVVALSLQVGVNYANDYSDGVRGTDHDRRGPLRLTASGLAAPNAVRRAALVCFALAGMAGFVLAVAVDLRLLLVGVLCIAGAWFYSGGRRPYGYAGLGELAVLFFFGFVATVGSAYVQKHGVPAAAWWGSLVVGLPATAVLVANNLRDIDTDRVAGKRSLAVHLGAAVTARLFVAMLAAAFICIVPIAVVHPAALVALLALPLAVGPIRVVMGKTDPASLVRALVGTVRLVTVMALALTLGLVV